MQHTNLSSSRQQDGHTLINSGERLSIENMAEFARRILEGMADADTVAVQLDANLEADITVLQVLCSACKTAAAKGKVFVCHGEIPAAVNDLVVAAGLERQGKCSYNKNRGCLWFGGGK